MYILLLQIATCTSHHSTDNTQYYVNMLPCDSGVAAGVSQMAFPSADQLTYIPHASLSAACLSLFTNIWFLKYKFVSPVLFHCLNFCLYFCPSAHMFLFITVSWGKNVNFWSVSHFWHIIVRTNLTQDTFMFLLPYLLFAQWCNLWHICVCLFVVPFTTA